MPPLKVIQSARPVFPDVPGVLSDLEQVLRSGRLMLGPYLERFESEFAQAIGCRYAIGVNSCTTALEIVLRYLGVNGAEVIVPTNTFIATANAVLAAGGTLVLTDINPDTLCLDLANLQRAVTSKTKAVIVVHIGGLMTPDIIAIRSFCAVQGMALIEDCAHAHGASFQGTKAGAYGFAGCFSFYPTKIMTTGTGGMITTDDEGLNDYTRSVRLHGRSQRPGSSPELITHVGNDWLLDEIRSVLGLHQLRQLDAILATRRALANGYATRLHALAGVTPLAGDARGEPSYYRFMVLVDLPISASRLKHALWEQHGIETERLYFPPCHLQPIYRKLFNGHEGMFPVAEAVLARQLCLPVHAAMSLDDVGCVVDSMEQVIGQAALVR